MLNVVIWFYNNGFSYNYSYEGRMNMIRTFDSRITEKQHDELKKICEDDKITFFSMAGIISMSFTPYEGEEI